MRREPIVLLAEDDEGDVILMSRAFKAAGITSPVDVVRDGAGVMNYLRRERPEVDDRLPALVILDMKMPRLSGLDVLYRIRHDPDLRSLPVAILTSSSRPEEVERAYELGANGFWVKPPSIGGLNELAVFIKRWLEVNLTPCASTAGVRAARALKR